MISQRYPAFLSSGVCVGHDYFVLLHVCIYVETVTLVTLNSEVLIFRAIKYLLLQIYDWKMAKDLQCYEWISAWLNLCS